MGAGESDVELFSEDVPKRGVPRLGEPSEGWRDGASQA